MKLSHVNHVNKKKCVFIYIKTHTQMKACTWFTFEGHHFQPSTQDYKEPYLLFNENKHIIKQTTEIK